MKSFIKKHPWLLSKCILWVSIFTACLLSWLNKSMLLLIELKGKNPNPPPPPPPVPPAKERPQLNIPYTPAWVAASFKDRLKHPVYKIREEKYAATKNGVAPEATPPLTSVATTAVSKTATQMGTEEIKSLRKAVSE